jgi:hypothetical protein
MALDRQFMEQKGGGGKLSKDELMDTKIAYEMMRGLILNPKAQGVIADSLSKPNPAPSMSIIIGSMVDKIAKKMETQGLGLSPRVWLAKNGAVDRALDEIAGVAEKNQLAFDERLQSEVFAGVIDQLKLAAQADENEAMGAMEEEQAAMGPPPPPGGMGVGDPTMMGGAPPPAQPGAPV